MHGSEVHAEFRWGNLKNTTSKTDLDGRIILKWHPRCGIGHGLDFVNAVINIWVSIKCGDVGCRDPISYSRSSLLYGVR
jgi:hypothetical protein